MASQEFIDGVKNLLDVFYNNHEGCDVCKKLKGNSARMVLDRIEIASGTSLSDFIHINENDELELVIGKKKQVIEGRYCPNCGRRLKL